MVRRQFGEHDAPSTLLGVAVFGYPDQLAASWSAIARIGTRRGSHPRISAGHTALHDRATLAWFDEGRRVVPEGTQLALVTDHCPATR